MTKQRRDALELGAVAGGDGDREIDGRRVHVVHGAAERGAEGGADLERSEKFKCESDAVGWGRRRGQLV